MGITSKCTSWVRWPVLFLACFMLIGSYYSSEMPAALKKQLEDYFDNPSNFETMFSLMYSLYSIPNIFLPFFGGYFVDRLGVRLCLLVFTVLIAVGQVFVAFGISIKSWGVIFLGRILFGFGGECLIVANSALLADWFRGTELAFAFGVNLSIARLGSVSTNLISPRLAEDISLVFACWFGVFLCAMSVMCVVITMPIDRRFDELKKLQSGDELLAESIPDSESKLLLHDADSKQALANDNDLAVDGATKEDGDEQKTQFRDVFKFPVIFWILCVSCVAVYGVTNPFNIISATLLLERDYFVTPPAGCTLQNPYQCESDNNRPFDCPSSTWYQPPLPMGDASHVLVTPCGNYTEQLTSSIVDCTDTCWSDGCTVDYCSRLSDAEKQAALIMSIPYIISGTLAPFLGLIVDNFGKRAVIITLSPVCILIVHLLLGFSTVSPVGPLVGQGLAYTGFAAVFWPAIPMVIEERYTGLAYGVVTSMLNLACAVMPLIVAQVFLDSNHLYIPNVEIVFVLMGIIGIVTGLYLNYYDYRYFDSVLNRTAHEARQAVTATADSILDSEDDRPRKSLLGNNVDVSDHDRGIIEQGLMYGGAGGSNAKFGIQETPSGYSPAPPVSEANLSLHTRSHSASRNSSTHSRSHSKDGEHIEHNNRAARRSKGSFTAHEEILYGGAFDHLQTKKI